MSAMAVIQVDVRLANIQSLQFLAVFVWGHSPSLHPYNGPNLSSAGNIISTCANRAIKCYDVITALCLTTIAGVNSAYNLAEVAVMGFVSRLACVQPIYRVIN